MAFDSKYFTGTDSNSYFTEQSKGYLSATGLTIGEEPGIGFGPLAATQKAIMHGFQTVMMVMHPPSGSLFGREDRARQIDLVSKQQLEATGEMININKMNFAVHGPIIDVLGYKGEEGKEGIFSGEQREENFKTFKKVIENVDKIAVKAWGESDAKKHNIPITIHPTNALASQEDWFDSGYKDNDGKPIYGKTGSMINRATGQVKPMQSTFKWLPIKEYKDLGLYSIRENTENNGFALFEVLPETHLTVANNTALDDLKKTITDANIKMRQIETNLGLTLNPTPVQKEELAKKYPSYASLNAEINSAEAELANMASPKLGQAMGRNIYASAKDFSNEVFPEQLSRMAMASYETKAQPVLALENMPINQFGKPSEVIEIVKKSREKFAEELRNKKNLGYAEAEEAANRIIGLTLDIGHLNVFKSKIKDEKTGTYWRDEDLQKEAEAMVKAGVNFVHIADNIGEFGKDSHLMIGRGNANIDKMLDILKENGFQGQAVTESFEGEGEFDKVWARNNIRAMGSMYESGNGPSFMDIDMSAQYSSRSSNYGHKVSELHWSQWGGPFAGLQGTFGGGASDKRDSFSGTPTN
jgi:sugar phosphate isomerase/epimerase